eukprot:4189643-Prymnesium_polylepis.1
MWRCVSGMRADTRGHDPVLADRSAARTRWFRAPRIARLDCLRLAGARRAEGAAAKAPVQRLQQAEEGAVGERRLDEPLGRAKVLVAILDAHVGHHDAHRAAAAAAAVVRHLGLGRATWRQRQRIEHAAQKGLWRRRRGRCAAAVVHARHALGVRTQLPPPRKV